MKFDKAFMEDCHWRAMSTADDFDAVIQLFRRSDSEITKEVFLAWIRQVAETISELDALQQHVTARFFGGAWWEGGRRFYGVGVNGQGEKEDSGDAPI